MDYTVSQKVQGAVQDEKEYKLEAVDVAEALHKALRDYMKQSYQPGHGQRGEIRIYREHVLLVGYMVVEAYSKY